MRLILILATAVVIVPVGLILMLAEPDPEPYPSDDIPIQLVDGVAIYTNEIEIIIEDEPITYASMQMRFSVAIDTVTLTFPPSDFGNQSLLSTGAEASVHQWPINSSWTDVELNITDRTGNGAFNDGDTIAFNLTPFREDMILTFELMWIYEGGPITTEFSMAIHDGRLYSWYSHILSDWY